MRRVEYRTIHGEKMIKHGRIETFCDFYLFTEINADKPIKITENRIIDISDDYIATPDEPT